MTVSGTSLRCIELMYLRKDVDPRSSGKRGKHRQEFRKISWRPIAMPAECELDFITQRIILRLVGIAILHFVDNYF